ncbi:MAG TPA: helix-turn-helix domain-containing protein [Thermodesulfobacteriota bacterium]
MLELLPGWAPAGERPRRLAAATIEAQEEIPVDVVMGRLETVPPEDVPRILGRLERVRGVLFGRLLEGRPSGPSTPRNDAACERLLTAKEVAELLGLKEKTVYELAKRGEIPCVRIGKFVRFRPSDLRGRPRGNG